MTLGDQLEVMISAAVRAALEAERPRLIAEALKELERKSKEPAWWSPADVRKHAHCQAQKVFDALRSGDLPGVAEEDPARARDGIPGRRWRIRPDDARAWAEARRGKGGAP
jgi:hypothetical protein